AALPLGVLRRRRDEDVAAFELTEAARALGAAGAVLEHGGQRRTARRVRILVRGDVEAARACLVDEPQRIADTPPVPAPARLVVGDLHGHTRFLTDADRFEDGVEQ